MLPDPYRNGGGPLTFHRNPHAQVPAVHGNISNPIAPSGDCFGIWPPGGQEYYANDCYGHDEPGIQFYSDLPGSGGNISWNVTLPVSRNITDTQSDLYTAIWFGMTLSDPYAWMNQCFLELQFYPDSDWNVVGPAYGSWVGAAVAWQIEAATGYEDACFYQELTQPSGSELLMTQGDQITVTMTGWVGNPNGENLTIRDLTAGESSYVVLYNSQYGYPLDPAYVTNTYANGLQWTPGGEYPVVFAFETGHTSPPFPNNNSFGGCSSGVPPPTPQNPSVPCPSYDPTSWTNDTISPWQIGVPTFFAGTRSERPSQVAFTQDFGGIAFIDPLSNSACSGRDGSGWCSYPWYSYSCPSAAFNFGATDYAGVTDDFGGYREYATVPTQNGLQLSYYPATNFSIPACGQRSYTVAVAPGSAGGGTPYFLSQPVPANRSFPGLLPGSYALNALPLPGEAFSGWLTTGGASVLDPGNPWTTLDLSGNGTVEAQFSSILPLATSVTFSSSVLGARMVVYAGITYASGIPLATLSPAGSVNLLPGVYSIQAYPPSGMNFSSWKVTGTGAAVAASVFPFTWLTVPSGAVSVTLTASFASSTAQATVIYSIYGSGGTISFDGSAPSSGNTAFVTVGTYSLDAYPPAGMALSSWSLFASGVLSDFRATTNVTLESGTTVIYATFAPEVTIGSTPADGGRVSFDGGAMLPTQDHFLDAGSYTLVAGPAPQHTFVGWSVSNSADLSVQPAGSGVYTLTVNASGTVTANFASTTRTVNLTLLTVPAFGGMVSFMGVDYPNGTTNTSLANGTYQTVPAPAPGYNFTGWTNSGGTSWTSNGFLNFTGMSGTVTAHYTRGTYPVTFVTDPPEGPGVTVGGPPGQSASNSITLWLSGGALPLTASLPSSEYSFLGWVTSPNETVTGGSTASLAVNGPGTVTLLTAWISVSVGISPSGPLELGSVLHVYAQATGTGAFHYNWTGLPPGCPNEDLGTITCVPNATGVFPVHVTINWSQGAPRTISVGIVQVVEPLALLSFAATPSTFTVGGSTTIVALAQGGVAPLSYTFSGLPTGCNPPSGGVVACTPTGPGVYSLGVLVRDAGGHSNSSSIGLYVNPLPTINEFRLGRIAGDVGMYFNGTLIVSGGTPPLSYAYGGLPPGCVAGNASNFTCAPSTPGTYTVTALATDADFYNSTATAHFTVHPAPVVGAVSTPGWSGVVNSSLKIVVNVTGGLPPYTFRYTGLPPGCHSANVSTLTCYPAVPGNYSVGVTASDIFRVPANGSLNLSVVPVPPPGPTPGGGGSSGLPVPLWLILLLVVVAAAAIAGLAVRSARRRRAAPPPAEPAAAGEAEAPAESADEDDGVDEGDGT